jgi:serine/threonine protein kinase
MCDSCDMQVSVGKNSNEIIRVGVLQFFIAARFVKLAVSLPQYQFASHMWSFGVVLYELAAAALPFEGGTAFSVGAAILQQPPAPLPGRLPLGLCTVIEGCLSKNVIERYQGFAEIAF